MNLHRTQILLESRQYQQLRRRAAEEQVSLSELVRRIVGRALGEEEQGSREGLRRARGMFADGGVDGPDIDRILYGREP